MKLKQKYVCQECGTESAKWMGRCTNCGAWDTLVPQTVQISESRASRAVLSDAASNLVRLGEVELESFQRIPTGSAEFNLVLGGGLVPAQVVLFAGEPGVGKSTLLLQTVINLSANKVEVLYASGEESAAQVASRAARLATATAYENIRFVNAGGVYSLLQQIEAENPQVVVVDSVQTLFAEDVPGVPGSLTHIKAVTSVLVNAAKQRNFALIIVGHINKEGNIAGPKALEHLVDTVLQFEGERDGQYRVLRVLKNRFGTTGEVGLFVMSESGLQDMGPEHNLLGGGDTARVGAAKTIAVEGNRLLVVEVQALTHKTVFAYPKRVAEGVSISRLQLICAILDRFAGTNLGEMDVYIRTAGGYKLTTSISDTAIAAAVLSSVQNKLLQPDTAYVGELTLAGTIHMPVALQERVGALVKYGIANIVSPLKALGKKSVGLRLRSVGQVGKLL